MTSSGYDSRVDTMEHIETVQRYMRQAKENLGSRSFGHDASKLYDPEKAMFDEFTPKLRDLTYGTDEYKACIEAMGPALRHHYEHNSHHPEHYASGIAGMSLFDLVEMLCDWKAAGERHADGGDIRRSVAINRERFGISEQLEHVLLNTIEELEW